MLNVRVATEDSLCCNPQQRVPPPPEHVNSLCLESQHFSDTTETFSFILTERTNQTL